MVLSQGKNSQHSMLCPQIPWWLLWPEWQQRGQNWRFWFRRFHSMAWRQGKQLSWGKTPQGISKCVKHSQISSKSHHAVQSSRPWSGRIRQRTSKAHQEGFHLLPDTLSTESDFAGVSLHSILWKVHHIHCRIKSSILCQFSGEWFEEQFSYQRQVQEAHLKPEMPTLWPGKYK